jgi:hypothetical protein
VAAIRQMSATMLHRISWLCARQETVGLGVTRGRDGASVIWTGMGVSSDRGVPIPVPAPGREDVPLRASGEWPAPEAEPLAYERPRGYPITVTMRPLVLERASLALFAADGATSVPGSLFTPERPIAGVHGQGSVFFLPAEPLWPKERYWAVFTAEDGEGREVRRVWTFTTR